MVFIKSFTECHVVLVVYLDVSKFITANLPPTLTKSQVNSVRKHLKIQMLNLLKHPGSYDFHENITTVLNDLGVSASEVRATVVVKNLNITSVYILGGRWAFVTPVVSGNTYILPCIWCPTFPLSFAQ